MKLKFGVRNHVIPQLAPLVSFDVEREETLRKRIQKGLRLLSRRST